MKGGVGHFKVYLVYFTHSEGIFSCQNARFPMNVLGLLFYSEVNNDFFYFGHRNFGKITSQAFLDNNDLNIYTPQDKNLSREFLAYNPEVILEEDLAFISYLCGLQSDSSVIQNLKSGINNNGILGRIAKYCVNLNRTRLSNKLELGYCVKKTTTDYVSDDVNENDTTANTEYKISVVSDNINSVKKQSTTLKKPEQGEVELKKPKQGEVEINVRDVPCYFFLDDVTKTSNIARGISVRDALIKANGIFVQEAGQYSDINDIIQESYKNRQPNIISSRLRECTKPPAQSSTQPQPQQAQPQQATV
jgi:hypothetical protein